MVRWSSLQRLRPLVAAALAGSVIGLAPAAPAQTLLDVTGASAVQGTLNNIAIPQYGGTLQGVKARLGKVQSQSGPSQGALDPGSVGSPDASAAPEAPSTGPDGGDAAAGFGGTLTYVNGHPVAICSHGGLCLGQLVRALRTP